jgi:hypothetical protein
MPSTLATELDKLGYDWDAGHMVLQEGNRGIPVRSARVIEKGDPILTERWANGVDCYIPRFIAVDAKGTYLPYRDIRGTGLHFIARDLREYLQGKIIPYPED